MRVAPLGDDGERIDTAEAASEERAGILAEAGFLARHCKKIGTPSVDRENVASWERSDQEAEWARLHQEADAVVRRYFETINGPF